jgi:uncharacterized protein (TIGR02646 family)
MKAFMRADEPQVLKDNGKRWTDRWVEKRRKNASATFSWPQHGRKKLNHILLPPLKDQTQDHCSFCDGFPVEGISAETIEHFHSKTEFPEQAFQWTNLYYACSACQEGKLAEGSNDLLAPDDGDFVFQEYFYWDFESGELLVNPRSGEENARKAQATITLYGLNDHKRPTYRKESRKRWLNSKGENEDLNRWPYRNFLVEA